MSIDSLYVIFWVLFAANVNLVLQQKAAIASSASFATGLAASIGVGVPAAVVSGGVSITARLTSTVAKVAATAATVAAGYSTANMTATAGKFNILPSYNDGNLSYNN